MSVPVLTFFNHKGGAGKTSLVYHFSWMFLEMGLRVVAVDLDPQANLTSAFLAEPDLERLWDSEVPTKFATTIYRCVLPLTEVGDIQPPVTARITSSLHLVPGDLGLANFEEFLSQEWSASLGSGALFRPFRILTALWQVAQMAAEQHDADLILVDAGPNLGAINRSALIGTDHVVIPLTADLLSLRGLRNLGLTLRRWRDDWKKRLDNWTSPSFSLPAGSMHPEGYVIQQRIERLSRSVSGYEKWARRIPGVYATSVLGIPEGAENFDSDSNCLARLKHYRSLIPMAQEARKPIFHLTAADGAIGAHSYAVTEARGHFSKLAESILARIAPANAPH